MITYIPEKKIIKEKIELLKIEKDILNHLNSLLYLEKENIEIYVQSFVYDRYLNIVLIYENKGIFVITEKEIDTKDINHLKNYLNSYLKLKYTKNYFLLKDYIYFTNLEKTNIEISQEFKSYKRKLDSLYTTKTIIHKEIIEEFKTILLNRYNTVQNDIILNFNKKQQELILREKDFKVKGAAGTGKTAIMLTKAVRHYREFGHKNLIVVYNITASNVLREKLNRMYKDIDNSYFTILHYHSLKNPQKIYDNIFIDEAQDFEKKWFDELENYLVEGGRKYLFGDEKQNIYCRDLNEREMSTPILGSWHKLKTSYRMENSIVDLALNFQKTFYNQKYFLDEIEKQETNIQLYFEPEKKEGELEYRYFEYSSGFEKNDIVETIRSIMTEKKLDYGKTAILTSEVKSIMSIMKSFENILDLNGIVSETPNEYEDIMNFEDESKNKIDQKKIDIERIRRNRKLNFKPFGDYLIFSTVHSFKGLERENIILVLSDAGKNMATRMDEIIYTGLTRCKKNLYIINIGLKKYDEFFKNNIQ